MLFRGKIIAVERRLHKGYSYSETTIIQQVSEEEQEQVPDTKTTDLSSNHTKTVAIGGFLKIPFKNEIVYVKHVAEYGKEEYIAMVPDLILCFGYTIW